LLKLHVAKADSENMKNPIQYLLFLILFSSLDVMATSMKLNGYNIKNRSEIYQLELGPVNDLLDERKFKLKSLNSKKVNIQGEVVSVPTTQSYDISDFYKNSVVSIQLGPVLNEENQKQILVVKIYNPKNNLNSKTIVFEANEPVN
jgi:hypothetical protein